MRLDYDEGGRENDRIMYKNRKTFMENFEDYKITTPCGKPSNIAKEWINYKYRRNFHEIVFEPNVNYKYAPEKKNKYNLWTGWEFVEEEDFIIDHDLIENILYHIKEVLCTGNEKMYNYVLCIWKLMLMGKKTGVAMCWSGLHGCGKNIILEYIGLKILGPKYYSYIASLDDLTNKFSSLRCNKIMIICDELGTWSGDHKTANLMKSLITQEKTKLEKKTKEPIIINDYSNLSLLSNSRNFIKVEGKSCRRYVVNECSPHKKNDVKYFNKLNADLGNKPKNRFLTDEEKVKSKLIAKTFFHFLMKIDISHFNPEKFPRTKMRTQMEIDSTPAIHSFIRWYLHFYLKETEKAHELKTDTAKERRTYRNCFRRTVKSIYTSYVDFCKYFGHNQKFISISTLRKRLKKDFTIWNMKENNIKSNKGNLWLCKDKNEIENTIKLLDQQYSFDPEIFDTTYETIIKMLAMDEDVYIDEDEDDKNSGSIVKCRF